MRTLIVLVSLLLASASAAVSASAGQAGGPAPQETRAAARPLINLNTATLDQLETLPGIGRRTAERIIEHRKKTPFTKIEQLMNVKGIGEKSFLRLKPLVTAAPTPDKPAQQ